jgi:hypothetical protein
MTLARPLLLALSLLLVAAAPASAIVGGSADPADWPHMTAVEFRNSNAASTLRLRRQPHPPGRPS